MIQPHEFTELVEGIEKALLRFESTSNHAVLRLYRKSAFPSESTSFAGLRDSMYSENVNGILASTDNEHVFLVYL